MTDEFREELSVHQLHAEGSTLGFLHSNSDIFYHQMISHRKALLKLDESPLGIGFFVHISAHFRSARHTCS